MRPPAIAFLVLLASCAPAVSDRASPPVDPLVAEALALPLMTDPDLASVNEANAALGGPVTVSLPAHIDTERELRLIRAEAAMLAGGVSTPADLPDPLPLSGARRTLAAQAALVRPVGCREVVRDYRWAARLPPSIPPVPRSATLDAIGSDEPRCAFRAVAFRTPLPSEEVVRFYHARAVHGGFDPRWRRDGDGHRLEGRRGRARFRLSAWPASAGGSRYDLVVVPDP